MSPREGLKPKTSVIEFPAPPEHTYEVARILLEPIMGTGEKITLLVAVWDDKTCTIIRGWDFQKFPAMENIYTLIRDQMGKHFSNRESAHTLADWKAPFEGMDVTLSKAMGDTQQQVAEMMVHFWSFLSFLNLRVAGMPFGRGKKQ